MRCSPAADGSIDTVALRPVVDAASVLLLGTSQAARLAAYVGGHKLPPPADVSPDAYPYGYRGLTRLLEVALPARPSATIDQALLREMPLNERRVPDPTPTTCAARST